MFASDIGQVFQHLSIKDALDLLMNLKRLKPPPRFLLLSSWRRKENRDLEAFGGPGAQSRSRCGAVGAALRVALAEVLGLQLRLSQGLGALPRIRPAQSTLSASTLGCVAGDRRRDAGSACNVTVLCYSLLMSASRVRHSCVSWLDRHFRLCASFRLSLPHHVWCSFVGLARRQLELVG